LLRLLFVFTFSIFLPFTGESGVVKRKLIFEKKSVVEKEGKKIIRKNHGFDFAFAARHMTRW